MRSRAVPAAARPLRARLSLLAAIAAAVLTATSGAATGPTGGLGGRADVDVLGHEDCEQLVPRTGALTGLPSSSDRITLDVLVVTETRDLPTVREMFQVAARGYDPLGIDLVATFRPVRSVPSLKGDGTAYLAWLKKQTGGVRPRGVDVVYLATSHDVVGAGLADCIGGIAHPAHAFAVGMLTFDGVVGADVNGSPVPVPEAPLKDGGAKLAVHEIGHLLGAHHHYGFQCGLAIDPADATHPCDVMFTAPRQQLGLHFGPVNAAVVREQARAFARP